MSTDTEKRLYSGNAHGVDVAGGVPAAISWYVAITGPRHEKTLARQLTRQGIQTYVATQLQTRIWKNGRRKTIEHVIIPNIVFIHCDEPTRRRIITTPLILRFMVNRTTASPTNPPATIPNHQIQQLQFMLGQTDQPVNFIPTPYSQGDQVRVIRGALTGLTGHITHNTDGTHTLTIAIPHLGGATVKIDPREVEPINTRRPFTD